MGKTYIPEWVGMVHKLAVYMTRYNSILRAAVIISAPELAAAYDALFNAVVSLDAAAQALYPLQP